MKRSLSATSMVLVFATVTLMLLSSALPVSALDVGPCTDDFAKFCSDVTPGGGRLVQCYEQKKNQMSADCIGWAEAAKANGQTLRTACADMMNARCNSEMGDPFRMLDCLQSNYIDLSMNCRVKLNEFKGRYPKPVQ